MILEQLIASALLGLATYRAWRIPALDQITEPLRSALISREGRWWVFLTDMILCPWCLGFWIAGAGAITLTVTQGWDLLGLVLVWLSASALAGVIAGVTGEDE